MLHVLLTVVLILAVAPQSAKRRKGSKPKAVVATKKVEASDPAREAIKALRTMATVAEIGTTYSNYTARLADVKIQVDDLLTKIPADDKETPYRPKHDIEVALKAYVNAAHYWKMKIDNKHRELDESYSNLISLAWGQARLYLDVATKALDKKK